MAEFCDRSRTRVGFYRENLLYDASWNQIGSIQENEVLDAFQNRAGFIIDNKLFDPSRHLAGYVRKHTVYDRSSNIVGFIAGDAPNAQKAAAIFLIHQHRNEGGVPSPSTGPHCYGPVNDGIVTIACLIICLVCILAKMIVDTFK